MSRIEKFRDMTKHVIYRKTLGRLSAIELSECVEFITDNDSLSRDDFAFKVNRWKLDQPKTKHHTDMWALVTQTNT